MNGNGPKVPAKNISIISRATVFVGKYIGCQETLIIEGQIDGQIKMDGEIIISPSGRVEANLKAKNISNAGTINGNISAKEKIEIKDNGRVFGNIHYKFLAIENGATLNGKCVYSTD